MSLSSVQHDFLTTADLSHLRTAARLALRGHGLVEPNPMVGCVITSASGEVVGWGYHRRFGGPHAEINALRMAGGDARGGTCYVTLEPCNHTGKTGPCSEAIINAGLRRVVIGRPDPNGIAAGGADRLREGGLQVVVTDASPEAVAVTDPFVHRVQTGLPWVIVKWAQTLDGRIAARTGESKWISSPASRLLVHRKRAKIDAILTGIGTVVSDDPMLTARNVRIRRIARRVIVDPKLEISLKSAIVRSASEIPTTIACLTSVLNGTNDRAEAIRRAGVELVFIDEDRAGGLPLRPLLRYLVSAHDATNIMVEAGPGLISRLLDAGLVCELWAFIAPLMLGDDRASSPVSGRDAARLIDGIELRLIEQRRREGDIFARYRVIPEVQDF